MLGDEPQLERLESVMWDFNVQFDEICLERLPAFSVAGTAATFSRRPMPLLAKVLGQARPAACSAA